MLFNDQDLAGWDLDANRWQDMSVIFQTFLLFPLLTALENICNPLKRNGISVKAAREWAESLLEQMDVSVVGPTNSPQRLSVCGRDHRFWQPLPRFLSTSAQYYKFLIAAKFLCFDTGSLPPDEPQ